MKNRDWFFKDGNKLFSFRSAGVLLRNGKILIQRGENDVEFALPGGCVAWGETSAETLVREYKEEMGADITVDRLIWTEEVFWKWGEQECHTICHYHLINLDNPDQIPCHGIFKSLDTDESRLLFQWTSIKELENLMIYPVFLKDRISNLSQNIEHFITRD